MVVTPAGPTTAMAVFPKTSILFVEGVAVDTVSLSCLSCNEPLPSKEVRLVCNRLQVGRVGAGSIPAQVVNLKARRNGADELFIREAMDIHCAASSSTNVDGCVTLREDVASPFPAAARCDLNLVPEAAGQAGIAKKERGGKMKLHRKAPFGVMQPEVIGLAAASIISRFGAEATGDAITRMKKK